VKIKQQEKYHGSKINQLLQRYSIAQIEFEKILGFKKAILITTQIKRDVVGNELLGNCSIPQLENVLKKLRSSYSQYRDLIKNKGDEAI